MSFRGPATRRGVVCSKEGIGETAATARGDALTMLPALALSIRLTPEGAQVESTAGSFSARHVWVAAGALHTPALLSASFGAAVRRTHVADHVLAYVGQVDGATAPRTHRTPEGVFFPAHHDGGHTALYTLRPAR